MKQIEKKVEILSKDYDIWLPPEVVKAISKKSRWVHHGITHDLKTNTYTHYIDGKLIKTKQI